MLYKTDYWGHHSSVDLSVLSILRSQVRIPSTPSMVFYSQSLNYIPFCRCVEERMSVNKKEPDLIHTFFYKKISTHHDDCLRLLCRCFSIRRLVRRKFLNIFCLRQGQFGFIFNKVSGRMEVVQWRPPPSSFRLES